jgi:hypothetical protein
MVLLPEAAGPSMAIVDGLVDLFGVDIIQLPC